jgi:hypothetical protein
VSAPAEPNVTAKIATNRIVIQNADRIADSLL